MSRSFSNRPHRIVVKVGTRVLTDKTGKPNIYRLASLSKQIAALQKLGHEMILVTSGAVGAGMAALGRQRTPSTPLVDLQMAAAIGQSRLMQQYQKYFDKQHCLISQVLLTHDDLKHRQRHLNARNTLLNLLRHQVVPIINENDAIAVDEMKVGDNDFLAAMVSALTHADLLILLTTPNGFYQPNSKGKPERVAFIETINEALLQHAIGKTDTLSTGGMASKLKAAQIAIQAGTQVVIASGEQKNVLTKVIAGEDIGTLIGPSINKPITGKRRWIAFFHKPQGSLHIDEGAEKAIRQQGKSLLPVGIQNVTGEFDMGAVVTIHNLNQQTIGQGLVNYSSDEIKKIMGKRGSEIINLLGNKTYDEVIHRDNFMLQACNIMGED